MKKQFFNHFFVIFNEVFHKFALKFRYHTKRHVIKLHIDSSSRREQNEQAG